MSTPDSPEPFDPDFDDPVYQPINGVLDLHTFRPAEVKDLLIEYIGECVDAGIVDVRIIHGKGIGTLRELVHRVLRADPRVERFELADGSGGSWGATVARLRVEE